MITKNTELMRSARESLQNKWGIAIATFLFFLIISSIASYFSFVVAGPLALGISLFSLNLSRNKNAEIKNIFEGFNQFLNAFVAYLLICIFTFLWLLLLIVPGLIKAIAYSMTFFIMNDEPELGALEAMRKSEKMMDGYKMKYFRLQLRFLGWSILCLLFTLGIGFLWLIPYMYVTNAKFYDDLKTDPLEEIGII